MPFGLVLHELIAIASDRASRTLATGLQPQALSCKVSAHEGTLVLHFNEHTLRHLQPPANPEDSTDIELQIICGLCDQLGSRLTIQTVDEPSPDEVILRYELRIDQALRGLSA